VQSRTTTFSLIALCALLGSLLLWRISAGSAETKRLEARISALSQELTAARQQRVAAASAAEAPLAQKPTASKLSAEPPLPRTATTELAKLNADLAVARTRISDLESKVLSLDADKATLAQQRQQELTAGEETCRARMAEVQRSLEAAQADVKAAQQRAVLFESENENLRKAQNAAPKAAVRSAVAAAPEGELDELSRRRDAYLRSLIRRYREIDNDYRAFMRDAQGQHVNDPALLRIQATLAQAEEDLRQIDSLNAKTLLVEKRRDKN